MILINPFLLLTHSDSFYPCDQYQAQPELAGSSAFWSRLCWVLGLFWFCGGVYARCPGEEGKALNSVIKIAQEWPLRPANDNISRYLQRLGERLVAKAELWLNHYLIIRDAGAVAFLIVRDFSVNAFSVGNGHIYITDGSLAFADTEAELARY